MKATRESGLTKLESTWMIINSNDAERRLKNVFTEFYNAFRRGSNVAAADNVAKEVKALLKSRTLWRETAKNVELELSGIRGKLAYAFNGKKKPVSRKQVKPL